jgi:toxin ParE1/3/4
VAAFEVVLTEGARRDLEDIYRYVAEHDSEARAERLLAALETACLTLETMSERGVVPNELRELGSADYREIHHRPFRIVYRVVDRQVIVHCALDGRRDMRTLLERRLLR